MLQKVYHTRDRFKVKSQRMTRTLGFNTKARLTKKIKTTDTKLGLDEATASRPKSNP